jgi:hypothetical protein
MPPAAHVVFSLSVGDSENEDAPLGVASIDVTLAPVVRGHKLELGARNSVQNVH